MTWETTGMTDALARARRSWDALDWTSPLAEASFVIPEAHYMEVAPLGLDLPRRAALNRLFACFTCELFVHFEAYVIRYLERHRARVPFLTDDAVSRFVAEEKVHSEMFQRLLGVLRPDLYARAGTRPDEPTTSRFLTWRRSDAVAVDVAPVGTFFLLAWLFEEITLFVPRALDEVPEQRFDLLDSVMRLHALEEGPHVAVDARVLTHLTRETSRASVAAQTTLAIPMLVFVDGRVRGAWRRLVVHATRELDLSPEQARLIRDRGPSQSDRWGMDSFREKLDDSSIAGASVLSRALSL